MVLFHVNDYKFRVSTKMKFKFPGLSRFSLILWWNFSDRPITAHNRTEWAWCSVSVFNTDISAPSTASVYLTMYLTKYAPVGDVSSLQADADLYSIFILTNSWPVTSHILQWFKANNRISNSKVQMGECFCSRIHEKPQKLKLMSNISTLWK